MRVGDEVEFVTDGGYAGLELSGKTGTILTHHKPNVYSVSIEGYHPHGLSFYAHEIKLVSGAESLIDLYYGSRG